MFLRWDYHRYHMDHSTNPRKRQTNERIVRPPPFPHTLSHFDTPKLTPCRLSKKGLHITPSGLSVKTEKRFDREDYIDATQRGIMKTMKVASFAQVDEEGNHLDVNKGGSSTSLGNGEEKEKEKERKSRFGLRRGPK